MSGISKRMQKGRWFLHIYVHFRGKQNHTKSMHVKRNHAHTHGFVRRSGIPQIASLTRQKYDTWYIIMNLWVSSRQIKQHIHQLLTRKNEPKAVARLRPWENHTPPDSAWRRDSTSSAMLWLDPTWGLYHESMLISPPKKGTHMNERLLRQERDN